MRRRFKSFGELLECLEEVHADTTRKLITSLVVRDVDPDEIDGVVDGHEEAWRDGLPGLLDELTNRG